MTTTDEAREWLVQREMKRATQAEEAGSDTLTQVHLSRALRIASKQGLYSDVVCVALYEAHMRIQQGK